MNNCYLAKVEDATKLEYRAYRERYDKPDNECVAYVSQNDDETWTVVLVSNCDIVEQRPKRDGFANVQEAMKWIDERCYEYQA